MKLPRHWPNEGARLLFAAWHADPEVDTLADLALALGVSKDSPGRWLRGERLPQRSAAGQLAKRYGIKTWCWDCNPGQRLVSVTQRRLAAWHERQPTATVAETLAHFEDAA